MLTLQTITTVSPIRSEADLDRAQHRLDELLAANAYDSADESMRDEFEVLTALIYYYEQRTADPKEWSLSGVDAVDLIATAMLDRSMSIDELAKLLDYPSHWLNDVLERKSPIFLDLAKSLNKELGISAEVLLHQVKRENEVRLRVKTRSKS